MALAATIVWEVQTGGSATNGGGFNSSASGTDYSQSTSAHATLTAASVVNATTTKITVNAGNYTVAATDIGNVFFLTGGTATAGYYEITAVDTGANTWTVDRSLGTAGQTCPGKMGGCINLPWQHRTSVVAGNITWIKTGTYTMSGGILFTIDGTLPNHIRWVGYGSTRGDSQQATVSCGTNTIQFAGKYDILENLSFTGTAAPVCAFIDSFISANNCNFSNTSGTGGRVALQINATSSLNGCSLNSTNGSAVAVGAGITITITNSYIHHSSIGCSFTSAVGLVYRHIFGTCIDSCATGISISTTVKLFCLNSTIYNSSVAGIVGTGTCDLFAYGNIISNCLVGLSWVAMASTSPEMVDYNNFYNNTTDRTNIAAGAHDTALDPQFVDAPNADFRVGANMVDQSNPIAFLGAHANCLSYPTKGALQREPVAGGVSSAYTFCT